MGVFLFIEILFIIDYNQLGCRPLGEVGTLCVTNHKQEQEYAKLEKGRYIWK